jgi:hypothetical protein
MMRAAWSLAAAITGLPNLQCHDADEAKSGLGGHRHFQN